MTAPAPGTQAMAAVPGDGPAPDGQAGRRARGALAAAVLVTAPLATGPHEIAMALALLVALAGQTRGRLFREPWGRAAAAAAVVWVLLVPASGNLREGLGHAWLFAPLLAIPALVDDETTRARIRDVGLAAAALAAVWALGQRAAGHVGTAGLSHHLSLAYALLPPLGVAVAGRRFGVAALLAGGVFATGSEGAVPALLATVGAGWIGRPVYAWMAGAGATLALLGAADPEELRQRAILWTGGLDVARHGAAGPGGYAAASAPVYDQLSPGFWFPNHAHDSAIQLLAVLGPVGLVATLGLCVLGVTRGSRGAAAGLVGVLVGALTQDTLGDLEVARAAWCWLALLGAADRNLTPPAGD